MQLSLSDAARALGKSDRQIRYLIQNGRLNARKVDGRWLVESEDLPLSDAARIERSRRAVELDQVVHEALGPFLRPPERKTYSVRDLVAFKYALRACRTAEAALGREHEATIALRESLVALGNGCHRFHGGDKRDAFVTAREAASRAVSLLFLLGDAPSEALAGEIEGSVLPALAGLLRKTERRGRR